MIVLSLVSHPFVYISFTVLGKSEGGRMAGIRSCSEAIRWQATSLLLRAWNAYTINGNVASYSSLWMHVRWHSTSTQT